jgi:hypothetical protein
LHLNATGIQPPINATVTVLRFFFKVRLDRPEATRHLVFVYEPPGLRPRRAVEIPQARRRSQAVDREHRHAHEPHGVIAN